MSILHDRTHDPNDDDLYAASDVTKYYYYDTPVYISAWERGNRVATADAWLEWRRFTRTVDESKNSNRPG